MAADRVERKLSAILAADVAGYSRLMGANEEGTLASLNGHRRELVDPCIARHRGRIVKTTGDGLLAEFGSVVDAVRCAVEVQTGMAGRNADMPSDKRLEFRIGINVGDVVMQDGDIFGDGVNIAARLESIADPGGICVSQRVQEDATGKVAVTFEDMGETALKNIARSIRAYRLSLGGAKQTSSSQLMPSLPDKPALAVLPFQNMSGDTEQDYFADGIVEDIITALSRFKSFAVVSRNSSFVYKGRAIDVRQVAKELGVRYLLEGSVRRSGNRLRITAQLVDSASGAHLWAQNYDGAVEDVFDFQDKITESVTTLVEPQIRSAEIERARRERPGSIATYDLYLKARPYLSIVTPEAYATASAILEQALAIEPDNAAILADAVRALDHRISMGWAPLGADDRQTCLTLLERALTHARDDAEVLANCGMALISAQLNQYDRGMAIIRNAAEANPNNLVVVNVAGIANLHCGRIEDALAYFNRAIRLSPRNPEAQFAYTGIAHAQMILGDYAQAIRWAEKSLALNPSFDATYWMLIAANAQLRRMDEAGHWLAKFRALAPGITVARIREGQPAKDPSRMAAILDGLQLAGLAEG